MKILLVLAHPRRGSLTGQTAEIFAAEARRNGHDIEWADLVEEGFDPVLRTPDEPDWSNPEKSYSNVVQREMARVERTDATVMVFPVWWWSLPAILKGWIDRVWNHGWAYGGNTFPQQRVWMIGIAGNSATDFGKRGYDRAMATQLETGILEYCSITERRLEILHGSLEDDPGPQGILARARELGAEF